MLTLIKQRLVDYPVSEKPSDASDVELREGEVAAVLLALTQSETNPHIVLTQRAMHMNSHRGEVAFPGGKWDATDSSLLFTALRESEEEIGLPTSEVEVIGQLPTRRTRLDLLVTPFVGLFDPQVSLQPNLEELDSVFQVPLSFFLDTDNLTADIFTGPDYKLKMPCYIFQDNTQKYRIWGFTLGVLVDFLNKTLNANIKLQYPDLSKWGYEGDES